jgi:hypothetical protein
MIEATFLKPTIESEIENEKFTEKSPRKFQGFNLKRKFKFSRKNDKTNKIEHKGENMETQRENLEVLENVTKNEKEIKNNKKKREGKFSYRNFLKINRLFRRDIDFQSGYGEFIFTWK